MKNIILSILLLTASHSLMAQIQFGTDVVTCLSSTGYNGSEEIVADNKFIIHASRDIQWIQANDSTVYTITSIVKSWDVFEEAGQVEFKVEAGGKPASIFVYRLMDGRLFLRIDRFRNGLSMIPVEFLLSSITTNE